MRAPSRSRFQTFHAQLARRGLFHIRPGLERTRRVLDTLGNPHEGLRAIHIAGTNGKGSVAASLESILRAAGYRTGLYTSPHLKTALERIRVQGAFISENSFLDLGLRIRAAEIATQTRLTYFEFLTVLAFLHFRQKKVEIAVVEVGLGGLWDSTNVLTAPEVCVITSIGRDHREWLGRNEATIARQKAGIIKAGVPVVCGAKGRAARVIKDQARRQKAPLRQLGEDFFVNGETPFESSETQTLWYRPRRGPAARARIALAGPHQVLNAGLVLAAVDVLRTQDWRLPVLAVQRGLAAVRWPGRLDFIRHHDGPTFLFDGAHNPPAAAALVEAIRESKFKTAPKTFIFSAYRDKEFSAILRKLAPLADRLVLTRLKGKRGASRQALMAAARAAHLEVEWASSPPTAVRRALKGAGLTELIVVTGSLSLVGALLPADAWRTPARRNAAPIQRSRFCRRSRLDVCV